MYKRQILYHETASALVKTTPKIKPTSKYFIKFIIDYLKIKGKIKLTIISPPTKKPITAFREGN